ncbi:MFS transporter [Paludibacterium paludis]|uniref:MFS transporter n=1 Tax=Paludibacterium paludis TaxID=1225769 RepID=UPI001675B114|nr:MFS transporter [Paludibacterium paludis]
MTPPRLVSPALLALAVATFAIGTAEFVIMGLLPDIAADLAIDLPRAGYLVSAYALGVVAGGPLLARAIARCEEKRALTGLMVIFIAGNLAALLAPGFYSLLAARLLTALSHASFMGASAVLAARLAPPGMAGRAMALTFSGMTLANILGVPGGTLLGQWAGWRATFAAVALLGVAALLLMRARVPAQPPRSGASPDFPRLPGKVWPVLVCSVLASASMFSFFTYLLPILLQVSALPVRSGGAALLLCGLGIAAGGWIGGSLCDWRLTASLLGSLGAAALCLLGFHVQSHHLPSALALVALWGAAAFSVCMLLQGRVIRQAGAAAPLASSLNIGAFNLGNALGAWAGGLALDWGFGLDHLSLLGAAIASLALLVCAGTPTGDIQGGESQTRGDSIAERQPGHDPAEILTIETEQRQRDTKHHHRQPEHRRHGDLTGKTQQADQDLRHTVEHNDHQSCRE